MIVKLDLDPKMVWQIEERAEKAGLTLAEYATVKLTPKAKGHVRGSVADRTRSEVIRLHLEGFTDEEIAARVDRVQEHVARLRRAAGLKPNRRRDG